jgi:hypothetical protein
MTLSLGERAAELARYARLHAGPPSHTTGRLAVPSVTVSLTTIPSRIHAIYPTLASLVDQTVLPSRIVVAIPPYSRRQQRAYVVPRKLERHPLVTILRPDRDWGPATKLIPSLDALRDDPDACVLAVDDDNVYPRTFVETMLHAAAHLPDSAIGLRGWKVPATLRWSERRTIFATGLDSPEQVDVLEGCGGVLVRPRFFTPAFRHLHDAALFADDVWIGGHIAGNGVRAHVVPHRGSHIFLGSVAGWMGPALNRTDNRDGAHEEALMRHFDAKWQSHAHECLSHAS